MLLLRYFRRKYAAELYIRASTRAYGTDEAPGAVLERWLNKWELATPPVAFLPGSDPPTALSWLRRRGPPTLPEATLHKLFRQEAIRMYDPFSNKVSRVRKSKPLPAGCQILIPSSVVADAAAQARERSGAGAAQQRQPPAVQSPEQQQLRLAWARELRRRLLYADSDLIAIDKPAGLAVQGGSGVEVSVDDIMGTAFSRLVRDPSGLRLVHRLDQQTTGVLVIAAHPDAAAWLSEGFRSGAAAAASWGQHAEQHGQQAQRASQAAQAQGVEVRKTYWAVLAKEMPQDVVAGWDRPVVEELPQQGVIDLPIPTSGSSAGSSRGAAPWHGSSSRGGGGRGRGEEGQAPGLPALTKFVTRQQDDQLAWVELRPQTGRKHQIRIHCAKGLSAPVLGDTKYGAVRSPAQRTVLGELAELQRREEGQADAGGWAALPRSSSSRAPMFLHCRSVLIKKPGQEPIRLVARPPAHWEALFKLLRWGGLVQPDRQAGRKRQQSLKR